MSLMLSQVCFDTCEAKCTYGTCGSIIVNTGDRIINSSNGLLSSVAYQLGKDAKPQYCLEGTVGYCGSLVQWLRDNVNFIESNKESEALASSVPDNGGVYLVPAFAGLFAPYWSEASFPDLSHGIILFNFVGGVMQGGLLWVLQPSTPRRTSQEPLLRPQRSRQRTSSTPCTPTAGFRSSG